MSHGRIGGWLCITGSVLLWSAPAVRAQVDWGIVLHEDAGAAHRSVVQAPPEPQRVQPAATPKLAAPHHAPLRQWAVKRRSKAEVAGRGRVGRPRRQSTMPEAQDEREFPAAPQAGAPRFNR